MKIKHRSEALGVIGWHDTENAKGGLDGAGNKRWSYGISSYFMYLEEMTGTT